MRTSTKIFIATLLLLAGSLAFYDWELAAQFRKGDYANPLYNYVNLNYRNFDQIELRSSSAVTLSVVQGGFKVLAHPRARQFLVVRQEGRKLIVSARFEDHWHGVNGSPVLYVSCPTLSGLQADAGYFVNHDSVTDRLVNPFNRMPTYITGFTEDSLAIREDHAANIMLAGNTIGKLTATLGEEMGPETGTMGSGDGHVGLNGPELTLEDNNHFTLTDFHILHQSRLSIKGTGIRQLTYYLADSASLTIDGIAARHLNLH